MKPQKGSYPAFYESYIPLVSEDDVIIALKNNWNEFSSILAEIPGEKENYAYAQGKWTIKQLINHLSDAERVFAYRALRFARRDPQQPLPFEEDDYVKNSVMVHRSLHDVASEFGSVRQASLTLFQSFTPEIMGLKGKTAAGEVSVSALGYVICGHSAHHFKVLRERYLKN